MIAGIRGSIARLGDDHVLVQVNGIQFRVFAPRSTLNQVGAPGDEAELFTHLHVREDALTLYGFATEPELELFEVLLTVSGIGPRVALNILSAASVDTLRSAIANNQTTVLQQVPGIGKKMAEKLVFALKDKIGAAPPAAAPRDLTAVDKETVGALLSLGYSAAEARAAVAALPSDPTATIERRTLQALQRLGS
ncbi:MAG: Holliday junction branch migration protein RuvA [Chloroflexi bacterium]|nr:Holliday junction branch migration protein RuvA [Chloroflexota bacterium]MBU1747988.1 Holliday junction branch migration protein RuvA [Chloroflexota bacterium]MBU1878852.1 Holliday junction branch migration protein RuvA [Chloroflexota bacterium]